MRRLWMLVLLVVMAIALPMQAQEDFSLTILHTSNVVDIHTASEDGAGGTARLATLAREIRAQGIPTLLLDTGDRFINPLRAAVNAEIMNLLGYDAMTAGNHEFNGGDTVAAAFIEQINFPMLMANVDASASPVLADKMPAYVILERDGEQIGVIGLTNELTPQVSSPGPELIFLQDEIQVTLQAVGELEAQGINKIILVAHRPGADNIVLASALSGVDVIVGGSDNTIFSSSISSAAQRYPVVSTSLTGEPVLIVQNSGGNRYLGALTVTFDEAGILTEWSGDIQFLDATIEPDAEIEALLEANAVTDTSAEVLGDTIVNLIGGDPCREAECALGNLIADALREQAFADIALFNSGGIRADLLTGTITDGQVTEVLPFSNTLSTLELTGADVMAAIEHGLSLGGDASLSGSGRFLQVSGLRFTWDAARPVGSRIVNIEVQDFDGEYVQLERNAIYRVATNNYIRTGGDDFSMLAENAIDPFDFGPPVDEVVKAYIRANSPIAAVTEGRITQTSR